MLVDRPHLFVNRSTVERLISGGTVLVDGWVLRPAPDLLHPPPLPLHDELQAAQQARDHLNRMEGGGKVKLAWRDCDDIMRPIEGPIVVSYPYQRTVTDWAELP